MIRGLTMMKIMRMKGELVLSCQPAAIRLAAGWLGWAELLDVAGEEFAACNSAYLPLDCFFNQFGCLQVWPPSQAGKWAVRRAGAGAVGRARLQGPGEAAPGSVPGACKQRRRQAGRAATGQAQRVAAACCAWRPPPALRWRSVCWAGWRSG